MPHLRSRVLLDASLARIEDVACRAQRSGPGDEEGTAAITLVVPRRGVFCVHRGSAATTADPNTVLVLGDGYRVSHPADGGDDCTAMRFAPDLVEEALGSAPSRWGLLTPRARLRVTVLTAALARGQLDQLEAEESALGLLDCLAPSLARGATAAPVGAPGRHRAERVRALLAADPSAAWRLEGIARAVHCSPFHLARQFRALTGETIARYLTRLRLAVGLERLAAGETELARLAVELGFAHHSHFTARFHAAFGITPSEARRIVTAPAGGAS